MIEWEQYPHFGGSDRERAVILPGPAVEWADTLAAEVQARLQANLALTMTLLEKVRTDYGRPIIITSGLRWPGHPLEAGKETPGYHCTGAAVDMRPGLAHYSAEMQALLAAVFKVAGEFKRRDDVPGIGIGINARGEHAQRFIHLDTGNNLGEPMGWHHPYRPALWSY